MGKINDDEKLNLAFCPLISFPHTSGSAMKNEVKNKKLISEIRFLGKRKKESHIIIVGVWPLNVLRDILLLDSSHQHHCKHTHPHTPHNFRHYLCCYHPNQYNHHIIIIYYIIITVASATFIFPSKPTFVKEGGIEEAENEGGGMGETPVGEKEIVSSMTEQT